jgi:hypothetical protein
MKWSFQHKKRKFSNTKSMAFPQGTNGATPFTKQAEVYRPKGKI